MNRFLAMAMGVAATSKCRHKHGALVVKHSHILGAAPNVQRNDPRYVDWRHASVHAEVRAMKRAGWPIGATVFIARVNSAGEPRLSKPCVNCAEILSSFKSKVVWTENT